MRLAFLLVVMVKGEIVSDNTMLFADVYRCNTFAHAIETGSWSPSNRPYYRQENLTAYCLPKMVREDRNLFE